MSAHVRARTHRRPGRRFGVPNERDQESPARAPKPHEYKPGWCANGCGAREVAPTRFGPGEPEYPLCRSCNGDTVDSTQLPERFQRGYSVPEKTFTPSFRDQVSAAAAHIVGKGTPKTSFSPNYKHETMRERTPGYVRFLVLQHVDGHVRDRQDAEATFAHEPWASEARYIAVSRGQFVFERPDAELLTKLRRDHADTLETTSEQLDRLQRAPRARSKP